MTSPPDLRLSRAPDDPRTPAQALDDLTHRLKRGPVSYYDAMTLCTEAREAITVLRDVTARTVGRRSFEPAAGLTLSVGIGRATFAVANPVVEIAPLDLEAVRAVAKLRDTPATPEETAPR